MKLPAAENPLNRPFRLRPRSGKPPAIGAMMGLLGITAILTPGCERRGAGPHPASQSATEPWFEEIAVQAGIDFVLHSGHSRRYWFPEIITGGAGLCDFDGDGFLDLFFVQGHPLDPGSTGRPRPALYRNRGNGTFEEVTQRAGLQHTGYGMGCACGDYDNDGDVDLYVTNVGPNQLYRNNGDGTFADVTEHSHVGDPAWSTSAAFVDYDEDDDLDLFVVNYINWSRENEIDCVTLGGHADYCKPNNYSAPAQSTLYRNNGDGTFTDVSRSAGMHTAFGNGLGVVCGDYNGDGRVDVYVANDGMKNQLWINRADGTFTDQALASGCALSGHGIAQAGMGVASPDLDNDGDWDLFVTNLRNESNACYLNTGGVFDDATARLGLVAPSMNHTGFGVGFADFNHDGFLDIYLANGRVMLHVPQHDPRDPYAEPNQVMVGQADGRFQELTPTGGTTAPLVHTSRGAAFGDIDNDGDVDIVVVNRDARAYLLSNRAGQRGNWIMFRAVNRHGSDALGAVLRIRAGGVTRHRIVQAAASYCSSNDPRVHCGLGQLLTVETVVVRWPAGSEETFGPFPAGELHVLKQGSGR